MDDSSLIVFNPRVHSLANIPSFFLGSAFFDPLNPNSESGGQFYRPLVSLSYAFIYSLAGPTPWVFHLFQIVLHFANTVLVLFILRKFIKPQLAFWLAMIFAIHPINQLSVIYISSLNDVLYLLFGLISFQILISNNLSFKKIILGSFFVFLSLLSKETGVLFIFVTLFYLYLYSPKKLLTFIYVFSYFLIAYLFLRFGIAKVTYIKIPDIPIMRAALPERLLTMPKVFWYYLSTFLFPNHLVVAQWWTVRAPNFSNFFAPLFLDIIILALIFAGGWSIYYHDRPSLKPYLFFGFWFFIGIGLHLQLWPLDWTVLDTWFYFPQIGLLVLIGLILNRLRVKYFYFFIILIIILGLRSMVRNFDWRDGITLFTHDLKYEDNGYLEASLAGELMSAGDFPAAIPHWQKALTQNPWGTLSWYDLGYAYERIGDYKLASQNYSHFLGILDPAVGYESLLTVELRGRIFDSGTASLAAQAVSKYPQNPRLWLLKSILDYSLGHVASASSAAQTSYNLSPSSDSVYVLQQIQSGRPIQLSP